MFKYPHRFAICRTSSSVSLDGLPVNLASASSFQNFMRSDRAIYQFAFLMYSVIARMISSLSDMPIIAALALAFRCRSSGKSLRLSVFHISPLTLFCKLCIIYKTCVKGILLALVFGRCYDPA